MDKTSICFFKDIPVRSVLDNESSKWWCAATDICQALTSSKNPRSYWNAIRRRNPQLSTICRQLKLTASDGKQYLTAERFFIKNYQKVLKVGNISPTLNFAY